MLVREFQINQQTRLFAPSVTSMVGPMGPSCRINEQNQTEGYYPAGVTSTTPLTRGVTKWYVYDGLGSVVAELDDNNMTTSREYDVYGAPRAGTQQGVSATSSQGYVGSLGNVTDASTGGLIYMLSGASADGAGAGAGADEVAAEVAVQDSSAAAQAEAAVGMGAEEVEAADETEPFE